MDNRINIYKGDSTELEVTVTDSSGAAFDLSNYTCTLSVKKELSDAENKFNVEDGSIDKTDAATGVIRIPISKDNTNITPGMYYYDVEIKYLGNVYTVLRDAINVVQDVSGE